MNDCADRISSAATAERLDIAESTLRKWRMRGYGPRYQKIGGEIRYFTADVDSWLDEQFVESAAVGGDAR